MEAREAGESEIKGGQGSGGLHGGEGHRGTERTEKLMCQGCRHTHTHTHTYTHCEQQRHQL